MRRVQFAAGMASGSIAPRLVILPGRGALPCLVAVAVLAMLIAGGCRRLAQHPLVIEAVEEVTGNERVGEALGRPVSCDTAVRGTANEVDGIASLQFDARGSQATGVVVVEGKKTRGVWGVTRLELRPAGGTPLQLTTDLEVDTPVFDPSAAPVKPSGAPPPPGEIEIVLPPGPPGQ
jgi:hypothetical protein